MLTAVHPGDVLKYTAKEGCKVCNGSKIDNRQTKASKSKYVQLNRCLSAVVDTYSNTECLDYLRAVSYNLTI